MGADGNGLRGGGAIWKNRRSGLRLAGRHAGQNRGFTRMDPDSFLPQRNTAKGDTADFAIF